MVLSLIAIFSALGSIGAISAAGVFLLFPEKIRRILVPNLVSYAVGTLAAAAFLGLIPRALETLSAPLVLVAVLAGIVAFFVLEKILLWRHCHAEHCTVHGTVAGPMILIGDGFHNFVDGAVIAASFVFSLPLGVASSLAIITHEIPQEVADFAVLLQSGYSRSKAFVYNVISASTTLAGAILTYFFLLQLEVLIPYVMSISAASFIYVALADLVPTLHHHTNSRDSIHQILLLLAGIATISVFLFV